MSSLKPEWSRTCRVCLQEGEIRSLFDICPESQLSYGAKVMQCSSVEIRRNDSLPDRICLKCIEELSVAYRFRGNCESSDAILQSYREEISGGECPQILGEDGDFDTRSMASSSEIQIPISSDVLYSYKPPSGLNVKLVSKQKTVLLENNGEIIICGPVIEKDEVPDGGDRSLVEMAPETESFDDDNDSLITYDDALPPSRTSQAGNVKEEDDGTEEDEGMEERPKLMKGLVKQEGDSQSVDNRGKQADDSRCDIFFDADLVYMDKEEDILNQLASIKRENDVDDWEIIEDDESSSEYFQKFPQQKASDHQLKKTIQVTTLPSPISIGLMKTIKTIRKANIPNEEKPTIDNVFTRSGPDGLETVIRVKRNLKPVQQQHICKFCNSSYKYKHALETHLRRHRGDKPYKCTHCEKAFVVPFELRRHMRTHTGAKPYNCGFCDRKFSDFGSKIKHERTHTGERPYVCKICEKSFTYSHVLNSHMLIHTGVKKYACSECGKRFAKSHHLKSHRNIHVRASLNNNNISKPVPTRPTQMTPTDSPIITSLPLVVDDDELDLDQAAVVPSHVDQLIADSIVDSRSNDFQLEDSVVGGSNPFGQLVNISDYMTISTKPDPQDPTSTVSIGAIMGDDDDDDVEHSVGCGVIHGDIGQAQVGTTDDDDDDPLLNVVTVLASSQVPGLVGGDYGNIQIINGLSKTNFGAFHVPANLFVVNQH
ncbi:uncharacterized protein LOC134225014 [Armigeres subalbatus]|uniref:uncharacterized protein LOC134225014 n=1 Tax=Armigeres subalbatus TaxID=124917 RepID=UPI002ED45FDB